jgi:hypothetical protein
MSGDRKETAGKLEYHHISTEAFEELAKVFKESKRIHGNCDSWRESGADSITTYWNALLRHMFKFISGPDKYIEHRKTFDGKEIDVEFRHSAQLIWNAMVICHKSLERDATYKPNDNL